MIAAINYANKTMKVIHILNSLKFSGAEIMYVAAAPLFQQKGCELTVVATAAELGEYAPYFENAGYKVLHKPYPPMKKYWKRLKYYWQFSRLLKREKMDVVHIHSHKCMWGISFAAWLAKKTAVYTFHNVFTSKTITYPYHYLRRWTAKNVFGCTFQTISDSVYENELHFWHSKTTKVYNWYDSNRFYPASQEEKNELRAELKIDEKALVIISVGGCSNVKRHFDIIKALPEILENQPDTVYLHLGEGITLEEEKLLAENLFIASHIRFVGNQTDVRKYLVVSDIYLMTSCYEGMPLTTIESMACNIPAILYDVPGLRDFNKAGENSILIEENYHTLAEKIFYLKNHPQLAQEVACRAKQFVNERFLMTNNVDKIYNLYLAK